MEKPHPNLEEGSINGPLTKQEILINNFLHILGIAIGTPIPIPKLFGKKETHAHHHTEYPEYYTDQYHHHFFIDPYHKSEKPLELSQVIAMLALEI